MDHVSLRVADVAGLRWHWCCFWLTSAAYVSFQTFTLRPLRFSDTPITFTALKLWPLAFSPKWQRATSHCRFYKIARLCASVHSKKWQEAVTHQFDCQPVENARPSLSICQLSFRVCSAPSALVGPCWWHFWPIERVESASCSRWDRFLWLAIQLSKPVLEKRSESDESEQTTKSREHTKTVVLMLHNFICTFQYVYIFIMTRLSGMKTVINMTNIKNGQQV